MVKNSGDVKGGVTKPKKAKASSSGLKHTATATNPKSKTEAKTKDSKALKKAASGAPKETTPSKEGEASKKSKSSLEIDGLFGQLKSTTAAAAATKAKKNTEKAAEQSTHPVTTKRPKITGSKDDIFGTEVGQTRKKTEEGYTIYTEDELGFGKKGGGDTDKCPFDCDCCF